MLEFLLGRAFSVVIIAVLARLLTPEDFGTFALLAIFLGVSTALVESGFGLALIQNQDTTNDDNCTVFWISLGAATVIALALASAAPLISDLFNLDVLVQLIYVMALTVWISGFSIVHRALLVKRLAFRQLAVVNLTALIFSNVIAIVLAWSGFGAFALAWQSFAMALLTSALLWAFNGWRPSFVFRGSSAKKLFGVGGYLLASKLLDVIYSKAYTLLIGKYYGPVDLGYFSRAESTAQLVTGLVVHPISQIAFPAFSKMRGDRKRIRHGLQGAVRLSMLINASAMFTLISIAEPFVLTILGPQWQPSVRLMQVLCLGAILMPLHVLNLQALTALGRSDLFFLLEVIKKTIGTGILVLVAQYGGMGIAWGLVLAGLMSFIINSWYSGIYLDYGPVRQIRQMVPSLALGSIAAVVSNISMRVSELDSQFLLLLVGAGASAATCIALLGLTSLFGYNLSGIRSGRRAMRNDVETGAST
jgi:O-antigen/teichoic acid export membrane protein